MKVEYFSLGFETLFIRYNLMIAVVVLGFVTGWYWMAALAVPIFLTCITGMKITRTPIKAAKTSKMNTPKRKKLAA